jgi:hypothetical protein
MKGKEIKECKDKERKGKELKKECYSQYEILLLAKDEKAAK